MSERNAYNISSSGLQILVLGLLLLLLYPGRAQGQSHQQLQLDPTRSLKQFALDTWQVEDGLPQNVVKTILQTNDGYIWIATQAGLARFDGVKFTVFDRSNTPALTSSGIEALIERSNGDLLIGTSGGGLVRRDSAGRFEALTSGDGLDNQMISALHEDRSGDVWIGTAGRGLYRYRDSVFTRHAPEAGLPSSAVLSLEDDSTGSVWVGTQEGVVELKNGRIVDHWLAGIPVTDLHRTSGGHIWAATQGAGLCEIYPEDPAAEPSCLTPEDGLTSKLIATVFEDRSGALWVGTRGGGINRIYRGRIDTLAAADGLPNSKVASLYQDRENSLWIGTSGGGISRLRGTKLATYSTATGLSHDVVLAVLEDRHGTLWVGTDGGGLNRLPYGRPTAPSTVDDLPSDHVYALHETPDGRLWAGLLNEGICVVSGGERDCLTTDDGLSSNTVYSMETDQQGNLWVGTDKGINRIIEDEIVSYTQSDSLPHNWVTAIHEDASGVVWIGTFGGLTSYHEGSFKSYSASEALASGGILSIHEDKRGTLWVGTKGSGLCRRDPGDSFRCYTMEDGLLTDNVLQIQSDDRGRLWTGHLKGIAALEKSALRALDAGERRKVDPMVFGPIEANGGAQPVSWRSDDGHLWFGTMSGVATIDPANIRSNTVPPPVHIERVFVEDEAVDLGQVPSLPPDSKDFEFHYTGLSFVSPEDVTFQYKLEGYDSQWVSADDRRQAFYTNVPPGSYTFSVRAFNNAGIGSEQAASIRFTVEPYFYQTTWFYVACILGIIGLTIGANHLRVRRLQAQRRKLSALVDEQTDELRKREQELKALNADLEDEVQRKVDTIMTERSRYEQKLIAAKQKAEESARLKSNILMNMSHEIRTPLASILGFVELLSDGVPEDDFNEFTDLINRSGQRLLDTVNSVLEMSELKAGSIDVDPGHVDLTRELQALADTYESRAAPQNVAVETDLASESIHAYVDLSHLRRAVGHVIGNAVKFTEEGTVTVRAYTADSKVVIEVEDDGQGIDEEFMPHLFEAFKQESSGQTRTHEGIGLGLTITRHLVELMGGSIEVDSAKGEGTCFRIYLPKSPASATRKGARNGRSEGRKLNSRYPSGWDDRENGDTTAAVSAGTPRESRG